MSIHVVAVITAKPGSEDVVRSALEEVVPPTRAEPGCLAYDLSESVTAPGTFVTVEEWRADEDLESHLASAHIQGALGVLGTELAVPPAVHTLTPLIVG